MSLDGARPFLRHWWLVPVAVATSLVVAFVLTKRVRPTYSASTAVIVVPEGTAVESVRDQIDALANLDRRNVVASIAGIAQSREVLDRAARRSGLDDRRARAYRVRSIVRPNTNILDIEVLGPDPAECAALAARVASIAGSEATANYRIYRLRTLDDPAVPARPVSPDLRRNLFVGAVLGALAGLLVAAAVHGLSRQGPATA